MPFKPNPLPPAAELWARYSYNPLTGTLHSLKHPKRRSFGYLDKSGYLNTVIGWHGKRQNVMIHRLVYKWVTGEEPGETIDHIDRNKQNNCIWNLRVADWSTQMQNRDYDAMYPTWGRTRLTKLERLLKSLSSTA